MERLLTYMACAGLAVSSLLIIGLSQNSISTSTKVKRINSEGEINEALTQATKNKTFVTGIPGYTFCEEEFPDVTSLDLVTPEHGTRKIIDMWGHEAGLITSSGEIILNECKEE